VGVPEREEGSLDPDRDAVGEANTARRGVDLRDPQPRVRELVGEEAELRDDRRPPPVLRLELDQLDLEDVSRGGAFDKDWAADRVDAREVELRDVLHPRVPVDLVARGVTHVQLDGFARLDLERGLDRVVPHVAERVPAKIVDGAQRSPPGGMEPRD
jgi:hypothetical protein